MTSVRGRRIQAAVPEIDSETQARLARVVGRLVAALHPDCIYLFGSQTRGEATADSDVDLLVVVPDTDERSSQLQHRAYDSLGEDRSGFDIVVMTREDFAARRPAQASLPGAALREGRRLYGRAPSRRRLEDGAMAAAGEGQIWLESAEEDLRMAAVGMQASLLSGAIYHAQQTFEKALKAFLAARDRPFRKLHNLAELLGQCSAIDPDFERFAEAAQRIGPYIYRFRYPPARPGAPRQPTPVETGQALADAREILDFVRLKLA